MHGGQDDVDGRAGQGHQQLLPGVVGHPLEPGHPADGQEDDVARADAEAPGGQRVPQLVQDHDAEQRQDEDQATDRLPDIAVGQVVLDADPDQQEEEREVDVDVDAGDPANPPGPAHGRPPYSDQTMFSLRPNLGITLSRSGPVSLGSLDDEGSGRWRGFDRYSTLACRRTGWGYSPMSCMTSSGMAELTGSFNWCRHVERDRIVVRPGPLGQDARQLLRPLLAQLGRRAGP